MINKFIGFCIFVVSLAVIAEPAVAQSLAGKTIRIVVPYAAGGTGDVVARVLAQAITQKTGQTIVVEDRPGASSIVGSEFAARAAPDGTTILLVENPFILSPILFPGHYDPISSFEPLCYVAATPAVLAVSSKSDIHTLSDYLKLATSKPGGSFLRRHGTGIHYSHRWRTPQTRCQGRHNLCALSWFASRNERDACRHDHCGYGQLFRSQGTD